MLSPTVLDLIANLFVLRVDLVGQRDLGAFFKTFERDGDQIRLRRILLHREFKGQRLTRLNRDELAVVSRVPSGRRSTNVNVPPTRASISALIILPVKVANMNFLAFSAVVMAP